jgi:hypothetical protein
MMDCCMYSCNGPKNIHNITGPVFYNISRHQLYMFCRDDIVYILDKQCVIYTKLHFRAI